MAQTRKYKDFTYKENNVNVPIRVESAVRDGSGVRIDTNYAKFADIPPGSTQILYETLDFTESTPNTYPFYNQFPYMATMSYTGITDSTYATVTYSTDQINLGIFAPICDTITDGIRLFSKLSVEGVQVPTVSIGFDFTDSSAQSDSPIKSDIVPRQITRVTPEGQTDSDIPGYPYKYSFLVATLVSTRAAIVSFGEEEASSGNWAQVCESQGGLVWIWSKTDLGATVNNVNIGYVII